MGSLKLPPCERVGQNGPPVVSPGPCSEDLRKLTYNIEYHSPDLVRRGGMQEKGLSR